MGKVKEYKLKSCIICKKEFKPSNHRQLTCSPECSKINREQTRKIHYKKNYFKKRKLKGPYRKERKCVVCNNLFIAKAINVKYCSYKCHRKYINMRNIEKRSKIKKYKHCSHCGKKFRVYRNESLCSEKCKKIRDKIRIKKYRDGSNYKLTQCLRARARDAIRGRNKSDFTLNLLGCSVEQLKSHLESQFKPGMNWDNHGKYGWHIDHIIPCAAFDLSKPEEQRKCLHYSNLQPLWAEENRAKSDKIISEDIEKCMVR